MGLTVRLAGSLGAPIAYAISVGTMVPANRLDAGNTLRCYGGLKCE